jgi:hypothetical protein
MLRHDPSFKEIVGKPRNKDVQFTAVSLALKIVPDRQ